MRAVDTNVVVRLLVRDDDKQLADARAFIAHGAWVSIAALLESVWVMSSIYRRTPEELCHGLRVLLDTDELFLEQADAVAAALDLFRARPRLGFTDCLILELARRNGHTPLGTFDSALAKVPGAQKVGR